MQAESKNTKAKPIRKPLIRFPFTFYGFSTLVLVSLVFLVLSMIPKRSTIEIDVIAKQVNFSLAPTNEEISVLYSGMWTRSLLLQGFQKIALTIDSTFAMPNVYNFQNPLTFTPNSQDGRVIFASEDANISVQEIICTGGSRLSFRTDERDFHIEIFESRSGPYETISFGKYVSIDPQDCKISDGFNNDITALFNSPMRVVLPEVSRSIGVISDTGRLYTKVEKTETEEKTDLIFQHFVSNLNFHKRIFQNDRRISTIDKISTKRSFPPENQNFAAEIAGELDLSAEPNKFLLLSLSQTRNSLRLLAQGKLSSLKLGAGDLNSEMVPKLLPSITGHPVTSITIAVCTWLLTIIGPLILSRLKTRTESNHDPH